MHPYAIAPNLVRIHLDKQFSSNFNTINSRLKWKRLTTNLDSCEEPPYLYFRITLQLRQGTTYAGFATGAPFMLTRERDVKKRAFFLRHWVRYEKGASPKDIPTVESAHMVIGSENQQPNANHLIVRVDIDRKLQTVDTFKSIPFATCMFQVVQLDAFIHEIPGVRFAFAIERTVTTEERDFVSHSGSTIPSKGPRMKAQERATLTPVPRSIFIPAQPTPIAQPPIQRKSIRPPAQSSMHTPPMQQTVMLPRHSTYAPAVASRNPHALYPTNPYSLVAPRSSTPRATVPSRSAYLPPASQYTRPPSKPLSRPSPPSRSSSYSRATTPSRSYVPARQPSSSVAQPSVSASEGKLVHPALKIFEDLELGDPYEPIFIVKEKKEDILTKTTVVVETPQPHSKRLDYQNLFGLSDSVTPESCLEVPDLTVNEGDPDIETTIHPRKKPRPSNPDNQNGETPVPLSDVSEEGDQYSAAVIAAAEYNSNLRRERESLKKWLEEDSSKRDANDEDDEDDDDDQESSD